MKTTKNPLLPEVTSKKYAELSGMSHARVKNYCRLGKLKARKIKSDGTIVTDYSINRQGTWFVSTSLVIGDFS